MLVEQENTLRPEPLFLDQTRRANLRDDVLKTTFRFPRLFNRPLYRSFEQLVVNCPSDFLASRSNADLRRILCIQFFLQKRIEAVLQQEQEKQKHLYLKLFKGPSRICAALVFSSSYAFQKEQILKSLDALLPGISEIPRSFFLWHSGEYPYYFCYFEVDKLRGKELSSRHLREIEKSLKEQILTSSPLTPAVFWPYNKEESHRQTQLLIWEMTTKQDQPHVSIHFQEQTASSLEFLVHLARPKAKQALCLENLPESLYFFRYSHHELNHPFPIEVEVFSIKMQAELFAVHDTINLLYARRYLAKQLEALIGPFRDYNGGLFEKQQDHFEMLRLALSHKIPFFDLFAEKVFYALHPFERWFSLKIAEVEDFFLCFSELIQDTRHIAAKSTESGLFTVVKTEDRIDFLRYTQKNTEAKALTAHAQLTIGNAHYECFSGTVKKEIEEFLQAPINQDKILRLIFQEGSPPSLNPHYSSGDMRCRLLNKLLFEGLTRLNQHGLPELAGARDLKISNNGLIYTFKLKKTHWSNGEKVTAFDYVESWQYALQDLVSHPELLFCIKNARELREKKIPLESVGIQAIDSETLQIELEAKDSQFLTKLAQPFFFPLFGAHREPKWFNGPYLVQESKKNGIKLSLNPYYWKTEEGAFEHIEVQWLDDMEAIYTQYLKGKVDWIGDPVSILSLEQIHQLEIEKKLKLKTVPRRFSLHFNTKHPILGSVAIRQALSLAIDRNLICKEIYPYSLPTESSGYSKELAIAFFEQGLRELNLTRATFPTLKLTYSDQTRRDKLSMYLQNTWIKTLGINVTIEKQSWNIFRSHLEKRQFEICGTIQDTINEHSLSFLERFEGDNSWNFSQWTHLVYRELITTAKRVKDPIKQYELKTQAENILAENIPFTPLFNYTHLYAFNPRIECASFDAEGCVDFSQAKVVLR